MFLVAFAILAKLISQMHCFGVAGSGSAPNVNSLQPSTSPQDSFETVANVSIALSAPMCKPMGGSWASDQASALVSARVGRARQRAVGSNHEEE